MLERLWELKRNLYWTWHWEIVEIFRELDPALWDRVHHNPAAFLDELTEDQFVQRSAEQALPARITHAFHGLRDYLDAQDTWAALHAGPLRAHPVAYFSAEFGLHESLPLYSGGLGVLAGDHLKAASDLDLPLVGVGLFYAKGYFNQSLNRDGWQEEYYLQAETEMLPIDRATDQSGQVMRISLGGSPELFAGVWTSAVGRCRLILLDTNVEGNRDEDRALTAQLYGGGDRMRIRQELVLGVGGVRAMEALNIRPGVIHLNEGHSAFAVLEVARQLMHREGRNFDEVQQRVAAHTVFTTHTPVAAGHDRFDPSLVEQTLGQLRHQLRISHDRLMALGRVNPRDHREPFCMTVLGLKMSRARNAVSALHGRITRAMWKNIWPGRSEDEVPIGYITNGIHVASWIAPPMQRLYSRYLGANWEDRLNEPTTWDIIGKIDPEEFWEQHQLLKSDLIAYVRRRLEQQAQRRGEPTASDEHGDQEIPTAPLLSPQVLTIGFARRFATYKRANLLLKDRDRLERLLNHEKRPVQFIFAGKAHPADDWAKQVIQQVFAVARDPRFRGRVVFLEGYDIDVSRHMVQGVDVWLNNPRRPLEACGTSGQKVVLNGGLNLSILDGWWAEAYDGRNGFAIGRGDEHADWDHQDDSDVRTIFEVLEQQVVPLYYERDREGVPRQWVARQKHAIRTLAWRFSARRMVRDYATKCYLPAIGGLTSSM